jgi:hypothetical protein
VKNGWCKGDDVLMPLEMQGSLLENRDGYNAYKQEKNNYLAFAFN